MGTDDLFKKGRLRNLGEYKRSEKKKGEVRDLFLIVCEGTKTEPNYFNSFRLVNVDVVGVVIITLRPTIRRPRFIDWYRS